MSIVACVKVYDGIVLGAESMTQLTANFNGQAQLVKAYENAQKIFQVAGFPIGILTYGIGNIGRRSIESFVHEFSKTEKAQDPPNPVSVEESAARFYSFMKVHYDEAFNQLPEEARPAMGFLIAGYSADEHLASIWEFVLPQFDGAKPVGDQSAVGAIWKGIWAPFGRLMFGIDPSFEQLLEMDGASPEEIERFRRLVPGLQTQVAFDGMPLADATSYCKFIIQTTIGWCTYAIGSAACGGPIKLATITPGSGFEWVVRPKSYLEGEKHG